MKKNSKYSLFFGVYTVLIVMMLPLLVFNTSCSNAPGSHTVYITYVKCVKGFDTVNNKPLPCPDTSAYTLRIAGTPGAIIFCFNSDVKDISHLNATLTGTDKSEISGSVEIIAEPMIISGEKLYPAEVKFKLGKKPLGNILKFSINDSVNPQNDYHMVLYLREKM